MAIPTTFDKARFDAITGIARTQGRKVTPEEWAGVGGKWQDYAAATGGPPQSGPSSRPFDFEAFDQIAAKAAQEGREVTPGEYASVGGTQELYGKMYPQYANTSTYQQPQPPTGSIPGGREDMRHGDIAQGIYGGAAAEREYNMMLQDQANRLNEVGPYGGANYEYDPTTGRTTRRTYLSPEEEAIKGAEQRRQTGLGAQAENLIGQMPTDRFSYAGMPQTQLANRGDLTNFGRTDFGNIPQAQWGINTSDLSAMPGADASERARIENQLYSNFASRMEPRFEKEREELAQRLANEGIPRGSQKFNDSMEQLKQQQNDAYQQAATQATMYGGEEQSRQFGMGMDVRQQQMSEKIAQFEASGMSRDRAVAEAEKQFGMTYQQRGAEWGEMKDVYAQSAAERERAKQEYETQRRAPYEEYNMVAGNLRGAQQPNVSGIAGINAPGIDVTGLGMGVLGSEEEGRKTDIWAEVERYKADQAIKAAAAGKAEKAEPIDLSFLGGGGGSSNNNNSNSGGGTITAGGTLLDESGNKVPPSQITGNEIHTASYGTAQPYYGNTQAAQTLNYNYPSYNNYMQNQAAYNPYGYGYGFGGMGMQGFGGMPMQGFGYPAQQQTSQPMYNAYSQPYGSQFMR
jgi:hypothetical protein